ncbi:MAG: alkaline phosphatase D family protein [Anaerolineae bacterium]|nr:alkaline phosphatase D family protein [Anaerolineae bacterium]
MRKTLVIVFLLVSLVSSSLVIAQDDTAPAGGVTHGPIAGEVTSTSVVLWARAGQASDLVFAVFDTPEMQGTPVASGTVAVVEDNDFTGEVLIEGLQPATTYYYTVSAAVEGAALEGSVQGQFDTAPAEDAAAAFSFTFGACIGGQGYCRPPETGWTIFETMQSETPDFFILMGDAIYADLECPSDQGQNVAGAEEAARYLFQFHNRYRYHLEDPNYAALLANTPIYVTWDDHEIIDNFSGQDMLVKNERLFEEGQQAYFDYWPLMGTEDDPYLMYRSFTYGANAEFFILDTRTYRDPIVNWDPSPVTGDPKTMLGQDQLEWLFDNLSDSTATWKFIVSSVPLSYPTGWPQPQVEGHDGWANGSDPSGYETELMRLLFFIETKQITNVVFLTGDIHWPAAIMYDPDLDGNPNFYEFSSSPLSALPLAPTELDKSFNPIVLYAMPESAETHFNFGRVTVSEDGRLSLYFIREDGVELFSFGLDPVEFAVEETAPEETAPEEATPTPQSES